MFCTTPSYSFTYTPFGSGSLLYLILPILHHMTCLSHHSPFVLLCTLYEFSSFTSCMYEVYYPMYAQLFITFPYVSNKNQIKPQQPVPYVHPTRLFIQSSLSNLSILSWFQSQYPPVDPSLGIRRWSSRVCIAAYRVVQGYQKWGHCSTCSSEFRWVHFACWFVS